MWCVIILCLLFFGSIDTFAQSGKEWQNLRDIRAKEERQRLEEIKSEFFKKKEKNNKV